jgi:hypothetical protein
MHSQNQNGGIVVTAILSVLLLFSLIFGIWAFAGQQDYKNNTNAKVDAAVATAKKDQAIQLQKQFDEQSKSPIKTYTGPATYGSVSFAYPKTWSAYIEESGSSQPINGYFHPNIVPGTESNTAYALRVELVGDSYSDTVHQYDNDVSTGKVTAKPFLPTKLAKTANVSPGLRLDGDFSNGQESQNGAMVIMAVRDKTLKVYTQSIDFLPDFNNVVLTSLTFSP